MKYADLVTWVSGVTRVLVLQGESGRFTEESPVFAIEAVFHEHHQGGARWLVVPEGPAAGTYEVSHICGSEVHLKEPFLQDLSDVPWELHDGITEDDVRQVLHLLPDGIMRCAEDEQVKTPMGVFRIVRRKRKRVKDPTGQWTHSPERLQARIRPGKRLQRLADASESSSRDPEDPEDPGEDPSV